MDGRRRENLHLQYSLTFIKCILTKVKNTTSLWHRNSTNRKLEWLDHLQENTKDHKVRLSKRDSKFITEQAINCLPFMCQQQIINNNYNKRQTSTWKLDNIRIKSYTIRLIPFLHKTFEAAEYDLNIWIFEY